MSSSPKAMLDHYELFPKKSLGQHFMHDPQLLDKIVDTAGIGAGRHGGRSRRGHGRLDRKAGGARRVCLRAGGRWAAAGPAGRAL